VSWPLVKLGTLVAIKTGRLDANAADDEGLYPFFTCSRDPLRINTHAFDCDAILIAGNGDLNVKHYSGKFNAYQRTYVVTSLSDKILDTRYLFYFMDKYVERLRELSIGGVIKYIKLGMLTDAEIPLPPLLEQKRIAAILDKADAIRRKRQQAIQLADDFLRAVFLDMFGDSGDGLKIEDLLKQKYLLLHKDGNHGSNYPAKEEFGDDGVVFISAKDISDQDGSIDYASVAYLNDSKARKLTIGWLKEGDVLLAHNATVGRVGLFNGEVDEALIGTSLTAFRPDPKRISSLYLFAALKYSGFQNQLKKNMGQSTRNQVPITAQRDLKIPVGDIKRQRQFERVFIKLKLAKSNLYAGLKESDEIFSSLSQKAFSGQL